MFELSPMVYQVMWRLNWGRVESVDQCPQAAQQGWMPSTGAISSFLLDMQHGHGCWGRRSFTEPVRLWLGLRFRGTFKTQRRTPGSFRPFELHRDGMVLSEGAGAVVLETLSQALERDARIYGEVSGVSRRARDRYSV